MRRQPIYTLWKVTCHSTEEAQALRQWLSSRIDLDRVLTDTVRATSNGVAHVHHVPYRLGDYFAEIRIGIGANGNPASFLLAFHRRPEAARFWKDMMVNILQEIETAPQKASIDLESKGDKGDLEATMPTTWPSQIGEPSKGDIVN